MSGTENSAKKAKKGDAKKAGATGMRSKKDSATQPIVNVAAYIRVSTDGQVGDEKYGLDAQKEQIVKYCEENGYNIIRWYSDEGVSGAEWRDGFDQIVFDDAVSNPPFQAVVVAKSDRVARDVNVYFSYKGLLMRKGIKLISVSEDFGVYGGFAAVLEVFVAKMAEIERDNITRRTSGGRQIKASRGGYSGGRAPMGYRIVSGCLVVDEEEAKLVRRIFALRDSGMVYVDMVQTLKEEGWVGRNGKPLAMSTVQSIVSNRRTYEGYYHYSKMDGWVKGQQEPILKEQSLLAEI